MVNLSTLYSLLFAFSLVLINPEGFQRGDIWTQPKLLALNLITTCNSWVVLHQWWQGTLAIPFAWKLGLGLWVLFLTLGLQSTLLSPFPLHSLWGQSTLGDGWVYWALLAAFVLSNALVIKLVPRLLRLQLYGLLIGGALVALSIFPQVWDWRIDYTATSGQVSLSSPQMLESTVWQRQMPIGFYSNRGHVAFVLATAGVLSFLGWFWSWIRPLPAAVIGVLTSTALLYTRVRGGIWALLVAATYLLWRYGSNPIRQWVVWPCSIGLLWISCLFAVAAPFWELEQFSSGRLHLWHLSLKGIIQRPLWGWGFDGFGIAYPFIADWTGRHQGYLLEKVPVTKVVTLNDFTFSYQGLDGKLHTGILIASKAHNLFLDTALSVGILGLLVYILLWGFFLKLTVGSAFSGIEAVAIAYLVYTLTWYESAQFSHLPWWALSVGLGSPRNLTLSCQLGNRSTTDSDYDPDAG